MIVHHPLRHPYVDHITLSRHIRAPRVDASGLPDPDHLRHGDVVHLHFGFEHVDAATLTAWALRLRRRGVALVHTAHDLDNPHLTDQTRHHRAVAALTATADAVVSLTPAAASELERRTGAGSTVVPHPHVVPLGELARRAAREALPSGGVYVHAATLRPNLDLRLVARVARHARRLGGLRVHVRAAAVASAATSTRRLVERIAGSDGVHLDVTGRIADSELWDRIEAAGVVLLPYRWGTHSGLAEAARDLGVPAVAPAFGGFGDQGASTYDDLATCLSALSDRPARRRPPLAARRAQRQRIAEQHRRLYERVTRGQRIA